MILGRGTAQTDEAIIAEFCQFVEQVGQIRGGSADQRSQNGSRIAPPPD